MTEYEEKLREYLKTTKELRAYIEKNEVGSYWNFNDNLFDFLGKTMHRVEIEIRDERMWENAKKTAYTTQNLGLSTSIEYPPRCPHCGGILYISNITNQCSCANCDYQSK